MATETHTFVHENITYTIYSGKSDKGNDKLLDDALPNDIWFHISNRPSAHIILSNPSATSINKFPRQVIKRCACICKASAKVSDKCEIIYTERENITKTETLGCVTTTNLRTIII